MWLSEQGLWVRRISRRHTKLMLSADIGVQNISARVNVLEKCLHYTAVSEKMRQLGNFGGILVFVHTTLLTENTLITPDHTQQQIWDACKNFLKEQSIYLVVLPTTVLRYFLCLAFNFLAFIITIMKLYSPHPWETPAPILWISGGTVYLPYMVSMRAGRFFVARRCSEGDGTHSSGSSH